MLLARIIIKNQMWLLKRKYTRRNSIGCKTMVTWLEMKIKTQDQALLMIILPTDYLWNHWIKIAMVMNTLVPRHLYLGPTSRKRRKNYHLFLMLIYLQTKMKQTKLWKRMTIFIDSGYAVTLIIQNLIVKLKSTKQKIIEQDTKAGKFRTHRNLDVTFTLSTFHKYREINFIWYVDEFYSNTSIYDLIIYRDSMQEIRIDICFSRVKMLWSNGLIPM
jgi:hypothetical protein